MTDLIRPETPAGAPSSSEVWVSTKTGSPIVVGSLQFHATFKSPAGTFVVYYRTLKNGAAWGPIRSKNLARFSELYRREAK